ncbi:Uncharacterised protein [Vibrio cholerae]|nr:Uncharacterised protein [Vibrio cholerae]
MANTLKATTKTFTAVSCYQNQLFARIKHWKLTL